MTQKEIYGVSMDEIKSHYDYGIRSDEDVARKILRDIQKKKYYFVLKDIKDFLEVSQSNDKIEITNTDGGFDVTGVHDKNIVFGVYYSQLRIESIGDEFHYYIIINFGGKETKVLDTKTKDVAKMISDIKAVYNWD